MWLLKRLNADPPRNILIKIKSQLRGDLRYNHKWFIGRLSMWIITKRIYVNGIVMLDLYGGGCLGGTYVTPWARYGPWLKVLGFWLNLFYLLLWGVPIIISKKLFFNIQGVSRETWQLVNSFECRLPYTVLDFKGCL